MPSFWRWPGKLPAGVDCEAVTAHVDFLPTVLELAGERAPTSVAGIDGRSMVPLLGNPAKADGEAWPERFLFTHVGRWETGDAEKAKYTGTAVRNGRFKLVNNAELYDLGVDPGETNNVIDAHSEVTMKLRAAYERWWAEVLPAALQHDSARGPSVNPFKERFWAQYGKPAGTNSWDWKMNPELKFDRQRPPL